MNRPDAWILFSRFVGMAGPWTPTPDGFRREMASGGDAATVYPVEDGWGFSAGSDENTGAESAMRAKAWADDSLRARKILLAAPDPESARHDWYSLGFADEGPTLRVRYRCFCGATATPEIGTKPSPTFGCTIPGPPPVRA